MLIRILTFLIIITVFNACSGNAERRQQLESRASELPKRDLTEILESGELHALTDFSSSSYFIYKGVPMGFEFELLDRFSEHIGVNLIMHPIENMDDIIRQLDEQKGDLIAANFTVTNHRKKEVLFTKSILQTRQVLVQRLPEKWWTYNQDELESQLIRNPVKLIGKDIHVRRHSSFYTRLINLMDEIGGIVNIKFADGIGTEKLIEMVSEREIQYTVADENMAALNKAYFPNIDIKTPLSFQQNVAWACRINSPQLLDTLNSWLEDFKKTEAFAVIHLKYFKARTQQKARVLSEYSSLKGSKISPYDDLIKQEAKRIQWDWKLLAAMIYEESRFQADAESWSGASGLMQLIPATAKRFGADSIQDPVQNIHAGVSFIVTLQDYWLQHINDSLLATPFILASYNVGLGHVLDACRLAEKNDLDRHAWSNVATYLELKSQPQYYNDEVVKHGYCRGSEPVNYVSDILLLWGHYRNTPI
ncbi:MAG: transporter substrate-binding domain-containing protein [Salibacteraceae bacterium]